MFVLPFVAALSAFFLILWIADIIFTIKSTTKEGWDLEVNPLMRFLLRLRRRYLILFKCIEIISMFTLIYIISIYDADYAVIILTAAITAYSIIVANSMTIYLKTMSNPLPIVIVFLSTSIALLLLANFTYSAFVNSIAITKEYAICGENYATLKTTCNISSFNQTPLTYPNDLDINFSTTYK